MTAYSKYRRASSYDARAIIAAIVICIGWAFVSEMDYQDAIAVAQAPCLYRGN